MKTTNQVLGACCWSRDGNQRGSEREDLSFPFSRRTDDGEADVATTGKLLVAVVGRGAHYSLEGGPDLEHVFVRSDGTFVWPLGPSIVVSSRHLYRAAWSCPKNTLGNRVLYLHHEGEGDHEGELGSRGAYVDADLLLLVLQLVHRNAPVVITVPRDEGHGGLDPLTFLADKLWDDETGRVRALLMPVGGPIEDGQHVRVDLSTMVSP